MFDFLLSKFSSIFSALRGSSKLTPAAIENALSQVQEALLQADVPYDSRYSAPEGSKNLVRL
jgi:signal recognition particle GTPase